MDGREKLISFIKGKRNFDGGYCFSHKFEQSSSDDTFFAVATLIHLKEEIEEKEKTIEYLMNISKGGWYP